MIDTSILIEYFRKKDKSKTKLLALSQKYENICISSITEFEIYVGATKGQNSFWEIILSSFVVLPFDNNAGLVAAEIRNKLKKRRKSIDAADLFILATALAQGLKFVTLNQKHFENIEDLELIES